MNIDLSGKIALITGGSSGIGRACSRLFSQSNATVVINYEEKKKAEAEELLQIIVDSGHEADIIQADISRPEEVEALFEFIRKKYGKLDILVNNAGMALDRLLLLTEPSEWDRTHDINLKGPYLCTKYAAEIMMAGHSGKIINISSISALRGTSRLASYASSKGGLVSFTKACAVELAGKGIHVNAVAPGVIKSDMTRLAIKRAGDNILERIPAGRYGTPDDTAGLVVFLASEHSDYITGQTISVDGGMSIT
jgi:3-oxoacyl-[acyl-carrier protein] reductase